MCWGLTIQNLAQNFVETMMVMPKGTCVNDNDKWIQTKCTAQMKDWDICKCVKPTGKFYDDIFRLIQFAVLPDFRQDPATGRYSIQSKTKFAPGCRSMGSSPCAAKYSVVQKDGSKESYGSNRCWNDEKGNRCPKAGPDIDKELTPSPSLKDLANFESFNWQPCTCEEYEFAAGDAMNTGVREFVEFIDRISADMLNSGVLMVLQVAREFAQKILHTLVGATNKLQYVIGLMTGTQSVIKLVPLSLAVLVGVSSGFDGFSAMTEKSMVANNDHDFSNMRKAIVVVIATATTVFVLPVRVCVCVLCTNARIARAQLRVERICGAYTDYGGGHFVLPRFYHVPLPGDRYHTNAPTSTNTCAPSRPC